MFFFLRIDLILYYEIERCVNVLTGMTRDVLLIVKVFLHVNEIFREIFIHEELPMIQFDIDQKIKFNDYIYDYSVYNLRVLELRVMKSKNLFKSESDYFKTLSFLQDQIKSIHRNVKRNNDFHNSKSSLIA